MFKNLKKKVGVEDHETEGKDEKGKLKKKTGLFGSSKKDKLEQALEKIAELEKKLHEEESKSEKSKDTLAQLKKEQQHAHGAERQIG